MPGNMQGVPMVVQSPLRHDSSLKNIDAYHHQNWKQIPEYPGAQHEEINRNYPAMVSKSPAIR